MSAEAVLAGGRTVRVVPGQQGFRSGGLLRDPQRGPEQLVTHREIFGATVAPSLDELISVLSRADLRGRGGAGFPAARKLAAVAEYGGGGPVVLVANGEEGEPASAKDRYLLHYRPHLVLDGVQFVAHAIGATRSVVYVSDPEAARSVRKALAERQDDSTELHVAPQRYVSGEETAVVRHIDGGPALPTQKPPRPFESGVDSRPTAVMNVETLARTALLWYATRHGGQDGHAADDSLLTLWSPDAVVLTEASRTTTLRALLRELLGLTQVDDAPILTGGFFAGFLPPGGLDLPLDSEAYRAAGTSLGCGSFVVVPGGCAVDLAVDVMAFFDRENAHQCGSCFKGTAAMHEALLRLAGGQPEPKDADNLRRWSQMLPGRGSCAALDGAAGVVATLLDRYADVVQRHREQRCETCRAGVDGARPDTRFRVRLDGSSNDERGLPR